MKDIIINSGGYNRKIGTLYKTNVFKKQVDSQKHKFRVLNAYGIDSAFLTKMLIKNPKIIVEEVDTGDIYSTDAKTFKEKGQYYHFKDKVDHDTQLFLPLEQWHKYSEQEKYEELHKTRL
jgi:hypothetical protein